MKLPDVYDNEQRFIFSNWSTEDFVGRWENSFTTIKAGETVELPMYKAYNFCKHFVDREMQREGRDSQLGIDEVRKPYEDKTIAQITGGADSPAMQTLKEKIRAEVEAEIVGKATGDDMASASVNVTAPVVEGEFADLKEEVKVPAPKAPKTPKAK